MSLRPFVPAARLPLRLLAVLAIFIATGCGILSPRPDGKGGDTFQYPDLKTPQHVLENLALAWKNRDSSRTYQLYTDEYIGTSTDQTDNSSLTFSRDEEMFVVGGLRRNTQITSVTMDFKPESTWTRLTYSNDSPGWTAIQLPPGVIVQVDHAGGTEVAKAANFLEFKFRPTNISGTDTTWGIVRWTEVAASKPL